jgi:FG-GAP-like repeat/Abnormal spindle-like microcephaly-assoc'd, ASPM-SPD-2-Hydin
MVIGDFNADGKLDLATANLGPSTVSILLGNGDGTFPNHVDYPTGKFTLAVTTGDLNGDGKLDLMVSNFDANTVSVLLGNGDGSFQPRVDYATGNGPEGGVTGDFNGDGGLDFAVTARGDNAVSVFLNTPVIAFYPSQITFQDRPVGTSSPPQGILVSNPGSMSLEVQNINTSGDFTQSNNCGNSILVAANCQINLAFSPTSTGTRTGTLTIADNAASGPHVFVLTGTGVTSAPVASLSGASVTFATSGPGSSKLTQTIVLTNTGNATLMIKAIGIEGRNKNDFSHSDTCAGVLNPGANCTIAVTFAPTMTVGFETATISIADNANDSPQKVALKGSIMSADFSLNAPTSTATITAGQTTTYGTLVLTPIGAFNQRVNLSCTGAPAGATCVTPPSIDMNGMSGQGFTVTVSTSARSLAQPGAELTPISRTQNPAGCVLPLFISLAILLLLSALHRGRPSPLGRLSLGCASTLFLSLALAGCGGLGGGGGGGVGNSGTPAGTYTLTVTGTYASSSTTLTHNIKLTLKVN